MLAEKELDAGHSRDEGASKIGKRRCADDNQKRKPMPHDGVTFIRLVANAPIVGKRNPGASTDFCKPYLIRSIRREVICMSLDAQTARPENLRKHFPKIPIGKIDEAQAARS
jgi:hypothetical protein